MKSFKPLFIVITAITIIVLAVLYLNSLNKNKYLSHNIKALMDTVQVYELKNNELLYAKQSIIAEKSEIENYLDISKAEITELEKKLKSNLATISKLKSKVRIDTVYCTDSVFIHDSIIVIKFVYADEWISLNGSTSFDNSLRYDLDKLLGSANTRIDNILIDVPLKIGYTEDYQIFATSSNPYISFSSIESGILKDPNKPKRFNLGVQVSLISLQYDLIQKRIGVGPSVGAGLSFGWSF